MFSVLRRLFSLNILSEAKDLSTSLECAFDQCALQLVPEIAGEDVLAVAPRHVPIVDLEPREPEGSQVDRRRASVTDQLGEALADCGAFLESGATKPRGDVQTLDIRLADNRMGVGGHV